MRGLFEFYQGTPNLVVPDNTRTGVQGMADALKAQEQDSGVRELSLVERLSLLVDQQWNWRENQAPARRSKSAKLRHSACIEDIDY